MRDAISYLDFDLLIRRTGDGYRAQVLSSPAGEASADFSAPLSDLELENFLLRVGRPRRSTRRIGSAEMDVVRTLGKRLYDAVFTGDVRACWRTSLSEAEEQNAGLRLRLRIADAPELGDVPWEYLYNSSLNRFLSLSQETPLVRYLDLPERIRPLAVAGQLEILVMISDPTDYPALDVEREWSRLNEALAGLVASGRIRLERLAEARLSVLQRKLRAGRYHALHFVGHGGFDSDTQEGVLVLRDDTGKGRLVPAQHLGTILHDHRSLRLVVLNACEGSRTSRADPFAGAAQALVQQGIPAVIAMQFEITDQAAITFAEEFYAAAADGYPVDAALAEARKAIFAAGNEIEWGTPVLHLRAPDGRLFSVDRVSADPPPAAPTTDETAAADTADAREETVPPAPKPAAAPTPAAAAAPAPRAEAPPPETQLGAASADTSRRQLVIGLWTLATAILWLPLARIFAAREINLFFDRRMPPGPENGASGALLAMLVAVAVGGWLLARAGRSGTSGERVFVGIVLVAALGGAAYFCGLGESGW
jgi:hypothetical protein